MRDRTPPESPPSPPNPDVLFKRRSLASCPNIHFFLHLIFILDIIVLVLFLILILILILMITRSAVAIRMSIGRAVTRVDEV